VPFMWSIDHNNRLCDDPDWLLYVC
jgi:hypothetical protein